MERNLKIVIQYDGTDFHGWQMQPDQRTVQGVLTAALSRIDGRHVCVNGSGRTDAGAHAEGQVATFLFEHPHSCETLGRALNYHLPRDVRVVSAEEMPARFHARYDAKLKRYQYRLHRGNVVSPFVWRYVHHCTYSLDVQAMRIGASQFEGTHDFLSMTPLPEEPIDSVRTLFECNVSEPPGEVVIEMVGSGFLRYMARTIAGTLVDVARGKLPADSILEILASKDRAKAGTTLPAKGLTLVEVRY